MAVTIFSYLVTSVNCLRARAHYYYASCMYVTICNADAHTYIYCGEQIFFCLNKMCLNEKNK